VSTGVRLAWALSLAAALLVAAAPSPRFSARTTDGRTMNSASLRGKVVILTWWAKWCSPCKQELADFDTLYRAHRPHGLELLALDADMRDRSYRFTRPAGDLSLPFVVAFRGETFPLQGVPTTYVLDRDGRLAAKYHGTLTLDEMRSAILPLLTRASGSRDPERATRN
jgi:cytochrome c biogenesis protein CcmG, thiol:disulfide interchange protein DsbE